MKPRLITYLYHDTHDQRVIGYLERNEMTKRLIMENRDKMNTADKLATLEEIGFLISEVENKLLSMNMECAMKELNRFYTRHVENAHRHLSNVWAMEMADRKDALRDMREIGNFVMRVGA